MKLTSFLVVVDLKKMNLKGNLQEVLLLVTEVLNTKCKEKRDIHSCGVLMPLLLCERRPFNGKDDNKKLENVKKGYIDFKSRPFDVVSKNGLDLLTKLLEYDYTKRISAKQALNHSWLRSKNPENCTTKKMIKIY